MFRGMGVPSISPSVRASLSSLASKRLGTDWDGLSMVGPSYEGSPDEITRVKFFWQ